MKIKQSMAICFGLILIFLMMSVGTAAAITVNNSTGPVADYTSIQAGIDNATTTDGDTIIVYPGIYTENVDVNKELTIISQSGNPDDTIVQAPFPPNDHVFNVTRDNVTISGFNLTGATGSSKAGIFLDGVQNNTISDNELSNNDFGILLSFSSNNNLSNNTANSNNNYGGIVLDWSSNNNLSNNTANSNNYLGIYLYFSSNNNLTSNTASDNTQYGIVLWSSNNILSNNTANSNNNFGIYLYSSSNNNLTSNTASDNTQYGIALWSSSNNLIYNNHFNNTANTVFYGTNTGNVWNTTKIAGTNIMGGPYLGGNYWANTIGNGFSQTCTDANNDGFCDSQFDIDASNTDYLPLTYPPNQPPIADSNGPYVGDECSSIIFNGSGSTDPDGDVLQYRWDFNNDSIWDTGWSTDPTASCTWNDDWSGTAKLEVNDSKLTTTDTATVTVNNVAPVVGKINAPLDPIAVGTAITVNSTFTDVGILDTHTAVWDWGDGNTSSRTVNETDGSGSVNDSYTYTSAGVHEINLTVTDNDGDSDESVFQYVVVYDSEGGFVTGGGWIDSPDGAYTADPSLNGTANFGFVSKYAKNKDYPIGNTEFQFHAGNLNFHSDNYDWLVINKHKAIYKGAGAINGEGNYGFMLSAIDAELTPSTEADLFRIKIWDKENDDAIVYDNNVGEDVYTGDDADPITAIQGGSIKIHKEK